jgi:adenylyltransferase/sulfurtransferase
VALVGADPLGYTTALYLAAAGVGRIAWSAVDTASAAAASALRRDVLDLNPDVSVRIGQLDLLEGAVERADDLILSTVVAAPTLEAVGTLALHCGLPIVVGCARGGRGWCGAFAGHATGQACVRCWDGPGAAAAATVSCAGTVGVIASLTALTAVKLLLNVGTVRWGTVLQYDAETSTIAEHPVSRRATCPACAPSRSNA